MRIEWEGQDNSSGMVSVTLPGNSSPVEAIFQACNLCRITRRNWWRQPRATCSKQASECMLSCDKKTGRARRRGRAAPWEEAKRKILIPDQHGPTWTNNSSERLCRSEATLCKLIVFRVRGVIYPATDRDRYIYPKKDCIDFCCGILRQ